jgi:hypothetical protein
VLKGDACLEALLAPLLRREELIGLLSAVLTLISRTMTCGTSGVSSNIDRDIDDRDPSDCANNGFSPVITAFASNRAWSEAEAGTGFLTTDIGFDMRSWLIWDFRFSLSFCAGTFARGFVPTTASLQHHRKRIMWNNPTALTSAQPTKAMIACRCGGVLGVAF